MSSKKLLILDLRLHGSVPSAVFPTQLGDFNNRDPKQLGGFKNRDLFEGVKLIDPSFGVIKDCWSRLEAGAKQLEILNSLQVYFGFN